MDFIIIDEVSMIGAEYLILLDSRLKLIYDANNSFREKYMLLSKDYLQMVSIFGMLLYYAIYLTTTNNKTSTQNLFSTFKVFHIND